MRNRKLQCNLVNAIGRQAVVIGRHNIILTTVMCCRPNYNNHCFTDGETKFGLSLKPELFLLHKRRRKKCQQQWLFLRYALGWDLSWFPGHRDANSPLRLSQMLGEGKEGSVSAGQVLCVSCSAQALESFFPSISLCPLTCCQAVAQQPLQQDCAPWHKLLLCTGTISPSSLSCVLSKETS